jgi:acyl-CoA reductase-like NAD-dependent aldehyde dehydrogenase
MDTRALDQSIEDLKQNKDKWASLPAARKAEYLEGIVEAYARVARKQVEAANQAKGIAPDSLFGGEEWAHPYATVRVLRLLRDRLKQISASGRPLPPKGAIRVLRGGQLAVRVFPLTMSDRLLYQGFRAEVWMQPDVRPENLADRMSALYRERTRTGKVALVLGAGNVASIGPTDLAHKLFAEGEVCLFKHNPVNEYLGPFLEEAFHELIRDGYVRIACGGADVGEYLCQHPDVEEIHLTGSDRTYEAIVFGPGEEGQERKRRNAPRLTKRVTCELGNVTPVIVVPGPWTESDIAFHAENIATQMTNNCGFNCLSARVLILPKDWPLSEALMAALRSILAASPQRRAYYPGAEKRYEEVVASNPNAQPIGPRAPGVLPYTLIPNVDANDWRNPLFSTECFLPVLAETRLPSTEPADFLRRAVCFANETLWGTLSAGIIIHPAVARELGENLEQALAALRYGTLGINQWTALGYVLGSTTWGAYPGHAPENIQSGVGVVHNTFMLDRPQKSVVYGPFRVWPKPPWFITNKKTGSIFSRMVELEVRPSWLKVMRIALTAAQG